MNPEERTEENKSVDYYDDEDVDKHESVGNSVTCTHVTLANTYERHNQHYSCQYYADSQKDEEESFAESFSAPEADVWDKTDEEEGYGSNDDGSVEGGGTVDWIEPDNDDGSKEGYCELNEPEKDVEGFGPWLWEVNLHVVIFNNFQ